MSEEHLFIHVLCELDCSVIGILVCIVQILIVVVRIETCK